MIKVTKSTNKKLYAKSIAVTDGAFIDFETGEEIELSAILENTFGDGVTFDLTAVQKNEETE